jgi:cytidylate kinase
LRAAEDAVVIDTTGMTIDEVVERLAVLAAQRGGGGVSPTDERTP